MVVVPKTPFELPISPQTPFAPIKVTLPRYDIVEYASLIGSTGGTTLYQVPEGKTFVLESVYICASTILDGGYGRMYLASSANDNNPFVEVYVIATSGTGIMDGRALSLTYPRGIRIPSGSTINLYVPLTDYGAANGTFTTSGITGYLVDNSNLYYLDLVDKG